MRIAIVAGELSGDQLGKGLVSHLKKKYPDAVIEGIGGPGMISQGLHSLYPIEYLSVMGFVEVFKQLGKILKARFGLLNHFKRNPPDIYIGIDAPDFNLPIEKKLRKKGIKTVHYVSPSVWAWREGRVKSIKKATDSILAILPFEVDFYKKYNHRVIFVGHPLANNISLEVKSTQAVRRRLEINQEKLTIAILPGSRSQEVAFLLPVFMETARRLKNQYPACQFIIPLAKPSLNIYFNDYRHEFEVLDLHLIEGKSHQVLEASDFVLLASGTAALEAMLYKKPMVMAYKLSPITFFFARFLVKIRMFSLPNILSNKMLIPELIQDEASAPNLAKEMISIIEDKDLQTNLIEEFTQLHQLLKRDSDYLALKEVEYLLGK
ncbi:lipid-A-disaccharide synthase [Thiotrichales bacterium 19S9-12]|nr:lipid-A-disaccharide synthase [Thiotrichales bacterium 19S9-11]MCF6812186.1 lipid-A-disaccharide synthase [Thiotrichales bacterium 19S9-12]